ncbi:MAG: Ppx/GppA family phosphatase, partial [Methylobacterium sp.]
MRDESAATMPARPSGGKTPLAAPVARADTPASASRPGRRSAYAALDLGTNNCRLLVAEPASHGFRVIDAFSRIVRLGEGLGNADRLSEPAIERTLEALRVCKAKMQARGVVRAKIIATEACRLAVNGAAFVERVRNEVGLDLEIVDRQTEAYLAVTG